MFFSPLHDSHVPEAEGLWLCGGYPELYARQLSENETVRIEVRERVLADVRQWRNAADFSSCRRAWRTRRELPGRCAAHSPDVDTKPVGCSVSVI